MNKTLVTPKLALGAVALVGIMTLSWFLVESHALLIFTNRHAMEEWVGQLGFWGALAIIALMMLTTVMSPIPSGPIAIASGALYGSVWGTTYVVIGAVAGVMIAFSIARQFGNAVMQRWSRLRPILNWLGKNRSQAKLMGVVFSSRLVPFVSFAAVSYAAGLTPIAYWRFMLATLVGVIPTAYLFTKSGEIFITAESRDLMLILVFLSGITLLPFLAKSILNRLQKRRSRFG